MKTEKESGRTSFINLWSVVESLSPQEILLLVSIERIRCRYNVSGRKWLPILTVVQKKTDMSLRDTYNYVKRLYGTEWHNVEFDYYNATRDKSDRVEALNYGGVVKKYITIALELDVLLNDFVPATSKDDDQTAKNGENDK